MQKNKIQTMVEIALFAGLALLFDKLSITAGWNFNLTVQMVPIVILALRRGTIAGMTGGLLWGLLQVITGDAYYLTPLQFFLEYFLAFALVGLGGVLRKPMQTALKQEPLKHVKLGAYAIAAIIIGGVARYFVHFIAGIVFWGSGAAEGQALWIFSLSVNGPAFLTELVPGIVALLILIPFYKTVLLIKDNKQMRSLV